MTACAKTETPPDLCGKVARPGPWPAPQADPFTYEPRPLPLDVLIAAHERLVERMRQIEQSLVQAVAEVHVSMLQLDVVKGSLQAHQEAQRGD